MKTIGETIRYWREHAGITAAELGRKVGIENHRNMSYIEADSRAIKLDRLLSIANVLKAPEEHFIEAYFGNQLTKLDREKKYRVTVTKK